MNTACSTERLRLALAGSLPPEGESEVFSHLETCRACSEQLEQMAGGAELFRETAKVLADDQFEADVPIAEGWSEIDFVVEHLDPADEPDVLGRLGGYDVLEVIGRGGMGVVLKGFDRQLKRCVAIKVLAPHLARSSLARQRFAREAQAAAAVVHPNVLAIHQVQPQGRLPFLVMPLLAGQSLAERISEKGTLELKEILRIGMQAAAGLAAAHEQGLVHRDVKPANILLEKGVERAVLTDFGLARAADDVTLTRQGIIAGTPEYMSPEQARGEPLDGRSDLFSLGSVIYQMAGGVSPFRADSTVATLRRLVDESPRSLASLNPELPPWLVAIAERLMEKDPARRFGSAKEVSQLLEGCLAHVQQPATVPLPPGLPKSARRNRLRPASRVLKGVVAMTSALAIGLACFLMLPGDIPDISGHWSGGDWGDVVLTPSGTGHYTGTFSDTSSKGPGELDLKWSRVERRFNGTWREGENRFGQISIRLATNESTVGTEETQTRRFMFGVGVREEIRGAYTTDIKSKLNPGTPALADLAWQRGERPGGAVASNGANAVPTPAETSRADSTAAQSRLLLPRYPKSVLEIPFGENVRAVAYSPDGKTVAIGGDGARARLYDARTGKPKAKLAILEEEQKTAGDLGQSNSPRHWVAALAFSPDSRLVAVGTSSSVKLFDAATGKLTRTVNDSAYTPQIAFSPDGALLAVGGTRWDGPGIASGPLKLWDVKTGELRHDLKGAEKEGGPVTALAFSPDGRVLVTAGGWELDHVTANGTKATESGLEFWNPKTGERTKTMPIALDGIFSLAYSPDASRLAAGIYSKGDFPANAILVLDSATGTIDRKLTGLRPNPVAFSDDGKFLAAFGDSYSLKLWDASTGELGCDIVPPRSSKGEGWICFAFAPDCDRLAVGGAIDGQQGVRIWSWEEKQDAPQQSAQTTGRNEGDPSKSFQFSRITATPALRTESQQPPKLIVYSPDGKTLATAGEGSLTVELFDAQSGHALTKIQSIEEDELTFLRSHDSRMQAAQMNASVGVAPWHISALAFSSDSTFLAIGNWLGQVKAFGARDGSFKFAIGDSPAELEAGAPRPVPYIATGTEEADALTDKKAREKLRDRMRFAHEVVLSIAFSPDGKLLVTSGTASLMPAVASGNECIRLWDAKTGQPRPAITGEHNVAGGPLAFSPDGKLLAEAPMWNAGKETVRGVKLRDPATGEVLKARQFNNQDEEIVSISFSPEGKNLAAGVRAYDFNRDRTVGAMQLVQVPSGDVRTDERAIVPIPTPVVYSPDGRCLAYFSSRNRLAFSVLRSGAPVEGFATMLDAGAIEPPDSAAKQEWDCFAFAPDGNRIAIGGTIDGKPGVRIWDLAEGASPSEPAADAELAKVDFLLAESEPSEGLTKAQVEGQNEQFIYLHSEPILTRADVALAQVGQDNLGNPAVLLVFTQEGAEKMAKATSENIGKSLAVVVDGKVIWAAVIRSAIKDKAQVTGRFTPEYAKRLVAKMGFGDAPEPAASAPNLTAPPSAPPAEPLRRIQTDSAVKPVPPSREFKAGDVVGRIAYSPDGATVATDNSDTGVVLFDAKTGKKLWALEMQDENERVILAGPNMPSVAKHRIQIDVMTFSPDSSLLAVGNIIGQVKLFDVQSGDVKLALDDVERETAGKRPLSQFFKLRLAQGAVWSIGFSPDGRMLATGGAPLDYDMQGNVFAGFGPRAGLLKIWDAKTGELKDDLADEQSSQVLDAAYSPDGKFLASSGTWPSGSGAKLWDVESGEVVKTLRIPGSAGVGHLAFAPDGKHLAMATLDSTTKPWTGSISVVNLETDALDQSWTVPGSLQRIGYSRDGGIVVGYTHAQPNGPDSRVTFWNATTGLAIGDLRPVSSRKEQWSCFSAPLNADRFVVGGNIDGLPSIRLWDSFPGPPAAAP